MTLTAWLRMGPGDRRAARDKLLTVPGVREANVDIVWDRRGIRDDYRSRQEAPRDLVIGRI